MTIGWAFCYFVLGTAFGGVAAFAWALPAFVRRGQP